MPRRRRRRTPPRCQHCGAPITFFWITFSRGRVRLPFDEIQHSGGEPGMYPVFGGTAWDINDLIAELQVMRGLDVSVARDQVLDMPWHSLHRCAQGAAARLEEARA